MHLNDLHPLAMDKFAGLREAQRMCYVLENNSVNLSKNKVITEISDSQIDSPNVTVRLQQRFHQHHIVT